MLIGYIVPLPLQLQCPLPQQEPTVCNEVNSWLALHLLKLPLLQVQEASSPLQLVRRVRSNESWRVGQGERASSKKRADEEMDLVHCRPPGDSHQNPQTVLQEWRLWLCWLRAPPLGLCQKIHRRYSWKATHHWQCQDRHVRNSALLRWRLHLI